MRRLRGPALAVFCSVAALSACTSSSSPQGEGAGAETTDTSTRVDPASDLAFADDSEEPLVADVPQSSLVGDDATLTRFEAEWVCELQRRTFTTPDAIEAALEKNLAEVGLTRDQYDDFRERVNIEQDLRDAVLFAYQEICQS